jgi:hypothetical protein
MLRKRGRGATPKEVGGGVAGGVQEPTVVPWQNSGRWWRMLRPRERKGNYFLYHVRWGEMTAQLD